MVSNFHFHPFQQTDSKEAYSCYAKNLLLYKIVSLITSSIHLLGTELCLGRPLRSGKNYCAALAEKSLRMHCEEID